jgi:transposase
MLANLLLPWLWWLDLEAIHADENRIMFDLTSRQNAACPRCGQPSDAVHRWYQRRLADLPCAGMAVGLRVRVRKMFCHNQDCRQVIFCERLPQLAAPCARRTERLHNEQRQVGLALGGEAGMRAARRQAMPVSATTLLRFVRHASWV